MQTQMAFDTMIIMMKSQIDFRAKKRGQRGARATSRIEDDLIKI